MPVAVQPGFRTSSSTSEPLTSTWYTPCAVAYSVARLTGASNTKVAAHQGRLRAAVGCVERHSAGLPATVCEETGYDGVGLAPPRQAAVGTGHPDRHLDALRRVERPERPVDEDALVGVQHDRLVGPVLAGRTAPRRAVWTQSPSGVSTIQDRRGTGTATVVRSVACSAVTRTTRVAEDAEGTALQGGGVGGEGCGAAVQPLTAPAVMPGHDLAVEEQVHHQRRDRDQQESVNSRFHWVLNWLWKLNRVSCTVALSSPGRK